MGGYLDIGLIDTMKDLFVNFIGAVVFSVTGFFYARSKGAKRTPAQNFVPQQEDGGAGLPPAGALRRAGGHGEGGACSRAYR